MKNVFRKISALLIAAVFMMTAVIPAFAENEAGTAYYVDSENGNDENDGTSPESAWKTLSRANANTFAPGDSLLLRAGQTFEGPFAANGSGSKDAPVTVTSYGEGGRPLIYSAEKTVLFFIVNVSGWAIDGIDFTGSSAAAIAVIGFERAVEDIMVKNCTFRDLYREDDNTSMAAISVNCSGAGAAVNNIHLDSLKFFDVGWAIHTNGQNIEDDEGVFVSPEESYNSDFLFENLYIENAVYGGIVLSSLRNGLVRNCRVLSCATALGTAPYAPLWMRHSTNVTVEYCEIAGTTNSRDGMAIDFDGWTTDSTYRYIYSHDNNRFIRNCVYDPETGNSGNSVHHCVSVNDNGKINHTATPLISTSRPSFSLMRKFSFYDCTIVNSSPIVWLGTPFADAHGLTFIGSPFSNFIHMIFNFFSFSKAFTYRTGTAEDVSEMINEITRDLPTAE